MKKLILILLPFLGLSSLYAQQWTGSSLTSGAISRTGNVGIGITPTVALEVSNGNPTLPAFLKVDPANANVLMTLQNTATNSNATLFEIKNKRATGGTTNGGWSGISLAYDAIDLLPVSGVQTSSLLLQNDDLYLACLQYSNANSTYTINNVSKLIEINGSAGNKFARTNLSTVHATYFRWDFDNSEKMRITSTGQLAIGTTNPGTCKLAVEGKIGAREVQVLTGPFPDYVFNADYKLPKLSEIEAFVKKNRHLPEVPSAEEVKANGLALGEMSVILVKKVEELTLYLIEQNKKIEEQSELIEEQRQLLLDLKNRLEQN